MFCPTGSTSMFLSFQSIYVVLVCASLAGYARRIRARHWDQRMKNANSSRAHAHLYVKAHTGVEAYPNSSIKSTRLAPLKGRQRLATEILKIIQPQRPSVAFAVGSNPCDPGSKPSMSTKEQSVLWPFHSLGVFHRLLRSLIQHSRICFWIVWAIALRRLASSKESEIKVPMRTLFGCSSLCLEKEIGHR